MNLSPERTLGEIVLQHPECARVFDAHRLDFCCGGKEALGAACARLGLDAQAVLTSLRAAAEQRDGSLPSVGALSTLALIAHIVDRYHGGLRRVLPAVVPRAAKVARVHGDHEPKMVELSAVVERLATTLDAHLLEEENVLFPALLGPQVPGSPAAAAVAGGLGTMIEEHHEVAALLERTRALTDGFQAPDWACTTVRVLFAELEALERDIHLHVHLENHALAPRFSVEH